MWGAVGGSSDRFNKNGDGSGSVTAAQLAASEQRTQERLVEMQTALNLILQRLPDSLGPAQTLPTMPATPTPSNRSVGFKEPGDKPSKASGSRGSRQNDPEADKADSGPPRTTGRRVSREDEEDDDPSMRLKRHGTLTLHLQNARDLIKADFAGLSDPYVEITIPGQSKKRCKTVRKTLNPDWDEKIDFEGVLEQLVSEDLLIEVFDQDFGVLEALKKARSAHSKNTDDVLGWCSRPIKDLMYENQLTFEDAPLDGVKTGTVTFTVTWTADSNVEANSVRALVERDPEVRAMLRDVRRAMDSHSDRAAKVESKKKQPGSRTSLRSRLTSRNRDSAKFAGSGGAVEVPRGLRRENSKSSMSSGDSSENLSWDGRKLCRFFCGPVLDPNSRFRTIWNVFLACFIVYCGVSVPFEIAFEQDMVDSMCGSGEYRMLRGDCPSFQWWFWLNFCVDMWFISDIVINMRTGYVKEGHFVNDDWLAAKNYLKGSFFMDCLGSFPLNIILMALQPDNPYGDTVVEAGGDSGGGGNNAARANRLLRLLRLAKLAKLARMAKLAKYLANFEEFLNPGVLAVIQLSIIALMCCHWFGCLWWLISDLELQEPELAARWYTGDINSWHPPPWLKNEQSLWDKYMHSFFWGAGMVTSMVPRDIEPVTALEAGVTTVTMFVGLLLNAFVISSLTTALATMNSKKELAGKQLDTIRNYLLLKGVPADLRSRILEYYEYLFTSSESLASSVKVDEMPPNLSAQLVIAMYRKLAAKCTVFKEVSEPCLITLMQALTPRVFVPNQILVFEGHSLQHVFFINRGHIQLLERTLHVSLLRDNDNFGLDDFMLGYQERKPPIVKYTAKAVTYCDVMLLTEAQLRQAVDGDEKFQSHIKMGTFGERSVRTTRRGYLLKRSSQGGKNAEALAAAADDGDAQTDGGASESGSPDQSLPGHASLKRTPSCTLLLEEAEAGNHRAQAALMA